MTYPVVQLGDIVFHRKEFIKIDDTLEYRRCRVQLHAKGIVERDRVPGSLIKTKEQQTCKANELLVAEIDAKVGGFGIVPSNLEGAIVSSHYFLFAPNTEMVTPAFLGYFVRTPAFRDQVSARGSTNYAAIRPEHVMKYQIPFPPLAEQQRIVAKIGGLAAKIEKARGQSDSAEKEADALWCSAASACFESEDTRSPIADLAEVRGGIQRSPAREVIDQPVRYLTVAHVQRNRILISDPRFFEVPPYELERWRLRAGDVLIIEGNGSAEQIGRTALFAGEIDPCVHQNHVIRMRPYRAKIESEFLNAYLNSPPGQEEVQARSRTTSGLRNLSVGRIKQIEVPVPPITKQRRIVAYLDGLQAKVDRLKALQAQSRAELDALLPSILDRAFKGEL